LSNSAVVTDDRSPFAANAAARACGEIGIVADLGALPLGDGSTPIVLSQFGVKYAGDACLLEAARITAPKGSCRR
jgi:hypothetical protein